MNTIILRGLDNELSSFIKKEARNEHLSANKWLVKTLRRVCGFDKPVIFKEHHDIDHLAGSWSKKEAEHFKTATSGFEKIDRELWK